MSKIVLIVVSLFFTTTLFSSTMFTLTGIQKVYPVVEISGNKVPKTAKSLVTELLLEMTEELGIKTNGYDQRSLAVVINERIVGKQILINVRLLLGEQVYRVGQKEKVFAITYDSVAPFLYQKEDDVLEKVEDSMDTLLSKFSEQYEDENKKVQNLSLGKKGFAEALGYETNYEEAMKRAKKEHKDVMLVLVANFCPWCRKFEERVLLKKEVNALIQKKYIPLILNKEADAFPKALDMSFTPIVHFISYKTQKSYKSVVGYNNRDEFIYLLKK